MATMTKFDVLLTIGPNSSGTAAAATTTMSGSAVDLQNYVNPGGRQIKGVMNLGVVTGTGTLAVRFQDSTTTAEAGFADITGAAFTNTGNSGSLTGSETIHFRTSRRYVRALAGIANTGSFVFSTAVVAEAKRV